MGCNCRANKQISFLEKKYGENMPKSKITNISGKVIVGIKKIITTIILIPIVPVVGIFLILKNAFSKKSTIDINKTFKIAN